MIIKEVFSLIRIHQWIKNIFVFVPIFFAGNVFEQAALLNVLLAFLAFSFTAGSVYVLNDIIDVKKDRQHPEKKKRPVASKSISVKQAIAVLILMLFIGLLIGYSVGIQLMGILIIYLTLNILYSFRLKHIAIIDIVCIASGFILRILSGGIAAEVGISKWLILMTFLLALFLALAKRRDEMLLFNQGKQVRKALDGYSIQFIDAGLIFMSSVTVVAYIMYAISNDVAGRLHNEFIYYTTLWVIIGILRYMQQTIVFNKTGSPVKMAYKDHFLQVVIVCWIIHFTIILYR